MKPPKKNKPIPNNSFTRNNDLITLVILSISVFILISILALVLITPPNFHCLNVNDCLNYLPGGKSSTIPIPTGIIFYGVCVLSVIIVLISTGTIIITGASLETPFRNKLRSMISIILIGFSLLLSIAIHFRSGVIIPFSVEQAVVLTITASGANSADLSATNLFNEKFSIPFSNGISWHGYAIPSDTRNGWFGLDKIPPNGELLSIGELRDLPFVNLERSSNIETTNYASNMGDLTAIANGLIDGNRYIFWVGPSDVVSRFTSDVEIVPASVQYARVPTAIDYSNILSQPPWIDLRPFIDCIWSEGVGCI